MQNLTEGNLLQNGKYRIIRVLCQGGFGITYLAVNTLLDREVAIKEFFPKDFCYRENTGQVSLGTQNNVENVEKLKARFLKEAKNIAKLSHPGIIKIHDVFEENHTAYYVMDYIEGRSLSEVVKTNGPLEETVAVRYITEIGDALEYIHSQHMTHFDVKPANIMLRTSDDMPILIDFGLSKQYDAHGDATSTIMQGISHGYSPIELYTAGSVSTFSPQTDVYSLGATLYYLVTGDTPPAASQVLEEGIKFPHGISPEIIDAINQAMRANRTQRLKTIKDFCLLLNKNVDNLSGNQTAEKGNNNQRVSEEEESTHLLGHLPPIVSIQELNPKKQEKPETQYGHIHEVEPTIWDRFLNWICGTSNLINAYQIPSKRKIKFLLALIVLIIAASMFPLGGWLILGMFLPIIRNSLQRLFFSDYLDELDEAADYSKKKATTIVVLILLIPIIIGTTIFSIITDNNKKEVSQYAVDFSARCASRPFQLYDVQITSASYVDGNIIYTCLSSDSIHSNRDWLNQLNVNFWMPQIVDESFPHYQIAKNNNLTFKFYNNGVQLKDIKLTPKDIEAYKNLPANEIDEKLISTYIELENSYLPWDFGANVKLSHVSLSPISTAVDDKEYLKYSFSDPDNVLKREFGDSLSNKILHFLPQWPDSFLERIKNSTGGIGYEIYDGSNSKKEYVICTSQQIKQMLNQKSY